MRQFELVERSYEGLLKRDRSRTKFPTLSQRSSEMTSPETVLRNKDTAICADLYLSFELGDKRWTLTMSDGRRGPSRYSVCAGDRPAVLDCIRKAKARCRLEPHVRVASRNFVTSCLTRFVTGRLGEHP